MDAIGKYRIVKRLAVGGMGEIFLAREQGVAGLQRLVVVKRMLPEMQERAESVALFIDEARIVAHLAHPNIVQIYELGQDGEAYFIAMEYVPGQNLARICERATKAAERPLTTRLAAHIVAELAHGLDFAHRATDLDGKPLSIVHRDVSPHNLLLSVHGDVKVMDFGIAKAANTMHRTQTGVIRGKYAYMSPEQLAGQPVDATTDVYAAGVVLWELSLLRRMFKAKDELELIDLVRAGTFARPTEIDPAYPRELEDIVMAALARDSKARTASAGELARQLRLFLSTTGAPIARPELGALVRDLFPEVDHLAPARATPEADPVTASMPASPPTAETTPQAPEVHVVTAPSIAAAEITAAPPSVSARSSARTRTLGIAVACGIAISAAVVVKVRRGDSDTAAATNTNDAVVTSASIDAVVTSASIDASTSGSLDVVANAPIDAADVPPIDAAIIANAPVDAGVARTKPRAATTKATPTTTATTPLVHEDPIVIDAGVPATKPSKGTLVVDSTPWGTLSGEGIAAGATTPRRIELPEGTHDVTLTLSEGGATLHVRARVVAGKKTKCMGTAKGLACAPPE